MKKKPVFQKKPPVAKEEAPETDHTVTCPDCGCEFDPDEE